LSLEDTDGVEPTVSLSEVPEHVQQAVQKLQREILSGERNDRMLVETNEPQQEEEAAWRRPPQFDDVVDTNEIECDDD
jgi:hypothetical protein